MAQRRAWHVSDITSMPLAELSRVSDASSTQLGKSSAVVRTDAMDELLITQYLYVHINV
jgi:hypothetical protein